MSNMDDKDPFSSYKVVVNHEEQYSIWPEHHNNPLGWRDAGKSGPKQECLGYIKEVWTDMRPLSLRNKMEEFTKNPPPPPASGPTAPREQSLVERLCEGDHEVAVGLRPEKTVKLFKEAIDRGYIHIKFTQTKGGAELGFRLDGANSDLTMADFENGNGTVHVEGSLTLDYVRVKCVADVDLSTLEGKGRLVKVEANAASVA
jgi:uncharacterized protein YbdZ (MbtH family)